MIDPDKPHFHVMVREDVEIRTVRTGYEVRRLVKELKEAGLNPFVEPCDGSCPLLFDRPKLGRERLT